MLKNLHVVQLADGLEQLRDTKWVQDFKGNNLLLFGGEWNIAYTLKQNPGLELAEFSKN